MSQTKNGLKWEHVRHSDKHWMAVIPSLHLLIHGRKHNGHLWKGYVTKLWTRKMPMLEETWGFICFPFISYLSHPRQSAAPFISHFFLSHFSFSFPSSEVFNMAFWGLLVHLVAWCLDLVSICVIQMLSKNMKRSEFARRSSQACLYLVPAKLQTSKVSQYHFSLCSHVSTLVHGIRILIIFHFSELSFSSSLRAFRISCSGWPRMCAHYAPSTMLLPHHTGCLYPLDASLHLHHTDDVRGVKSWAISWFHG